MSTVAAATAAGFLALALAPLPVDAHIGAGFPGRMPPALQARAKRTMQRRQVTYNDQSWQSVTAASQECTAYSYGHVSSWKSAFPTSWVIADIVSGDTEAHDLYNKISPGIPNIAPKGVSTNSRQGVTYNTQQDPDCWWTETQCTQPKQHGLKADVTSCPEPRTWGLTFDDGPNCTHNAFYDFLKQNKQTATLFYIGSNVYDWPLQAQRGLTDGHQLACHTWSHRYTTSLTNSQVFAEFYYTIKIIKWVTGVTVTSWRPPYGDVDDRVRYIAAQLGLETVLWDHDTNDWSVQPEGTAPTSQILANYASIVSAGQSASAGIVVLTHEINADTMQLAMQEYPIIKKAFAHVVPFQTCLNNTTPYKEDIVYPNFAEYIAGTVMPSTVPSAQDITASSVSSLAVGTASASYSVTDISPSSSARSAGTSGASGDSASSKGVGDKKSSSSPLEAAVGLAGAAMAGGAAMLFM